MRFVSMPSRAKLAAASVHVLTALGVVCGLAALHYGADRQWETAFAWLGAALIIDGLDGPLARRVQIEEALPRFSGVRLDLVVDYLTYCAVPAFILWESGLLPAGWNAPAACLVATASLFHFADLQSKTDDGYFVGFPGLWNVAVFYLFAFGLGGWPALLIVVALVAAIFLPLTWAHPLRIHHFRLATVAVTVVWAIAAVATLAHGFPAPIWAQAVLAAGAAYMVAVGLWRGLRGPDGQRR